LALAFPLCILGIELLLEFLFEPNPSGDEIKSYFDVVTPTMPPNKGYVFKEKEAFLIL